MPNLVTFQKFETRQEAENAADILRQKQIACNIEENTLLLDQNIIGRQYDNYVLLKLNSEDFPRARQALMDATVIDLDQVDKDYMLLSFTDLELLDVVAKPDEWGIYNYKLALALLQQRGTPIDDKKQEQMERERLAELSQPRTAPASWLWAGYGFSLISIFACLFNSGTALLLLYFFYFIPGMLGIILGLMLVLSKRTLPDGSQILSFTKGSRRHGLYMLLLGGVLLTMLTLRGFGMWMPHDMILGY